MRDNKMSKRQFTLLGSGILASAFGIPGVKSGSPATVLAQAKTDDRQTGGAETLVYDVACDARTFRLNKQGTILDARRGDGFIVQGKIYRGGTIMPGGTMESPGPFNLDVAQGNIGNWICRGTFYYDIGEILQEKHPHLFSTQYHLFDDHSGLVHEGPEGGAPQMRAVTGGMGGFAGVAGEVLEAPLGTNSTGLFNLRYTFQIRKK